MKSIIKTSFFTVLLMAVFSIGFSNASAEEANQIVNESITIVHTNSEIYGSTAKFLDPQCYVVVVYEDGTVVSYPVPCEDVPPNENLNQM